jgi:uncharacterized protein (DUF2249 family)
MLPLSAKDQDYLKRVSPIPLRGLPVQLGSKPTRTAGTGGDFFRLRPYVAGDDPRTIAWRLGTRHKQWLVREQVHEGPMKWRVWVDRTSSMDLPERKTVVGKVLASIDWVWRRHRDGLRLVDAWGWGETPLLLVSDFIWDDGQWKDFLRLKRQQHVILVRVLYPEELRWDGTADAVQDCETGEKLRIDNDHPAIQGRQSDYWKRVEQHCRGLPCATWVLGRADLTCLEGVIWA